MNYPRICYLGGYHPQYPRNLVIRRGLGELGVPVVECRASSKISTRQRIAELTPRFEAVADQCDIILLAEFNQTLATFARRLARRYQKYLIIDAFTSVYDSAVEDRGTSAALSLRGLYYRWVDRQMLRAADHLLADTAHHRDYFVEAYGVSPEKFTVVPVGASREWFELPHPPPHPPRVGRGGSKSTQEDFHVADDKLQILFYGTYIPLHGIETIIGAADRLRGRDDLHFELIGRGQTFKTIEAQVGELALPDLTLSEPVSPDDLPGRVAAADLCLGIFGTTAKAARVVPNKVYQTLALGKPVITADTPALREFFTPEEHLIGVPAGDAVALAAAIERLADDPALRERIAVAGRARVEGEFSEVAIARRLLESLN